MPSDRRLSQALSTVLMHLLTVLIICSAVAGPVCALEPLDALTAESSAAYMDFGDGVTADVLTEDECFGAAPKCAMLSPVTSACSMFRRHRFLVAPSRVVGRNTSESNASGSPGTGRATANKFSRRYLPAACRTRRSSSNSRCSAC
jgi:hypothetical protein